MLDALDGRSHAIGLRLLAYGLFALRHVLTSTLHDVFSVGALTL